MQRLVKYAFMLCVLSVSVFTYTVAAVSAILPADIDDYAAFFNRHYPLAVDGNAESLLYIGALYENGLGIEKDLTLSHVYYNLASAAGLEEAIQQRKRIEKQLNKEEFANARKLAKLYKHGTGIDHLRQTESLQTLAAAKSSTTETIPKEVTEQEAKQITTPSPEDEKESEVKEEDVHIKFFNAVVNNNTTLVANLVSSAGIDVDYRFNDDKTALMLASELGNLSTVGALLDLGANADLKSVDNETALKIAVDSGHDYIAAVLRTKTSVLVPTQLVEDIQLYLSKLGYNPGPADGLYGSKTKRSLERFAKEYKQSFPIEISQRQLNTLKSAHTNYAAKKANELKLQEILQVQDN